ncbi:unnamed protein product [Rotaria sp. Silwood2]|nr:unnamed protein product [Rotaria sp. Silwood2]CAF3054532.1 unnamed protein product [Rotaria sp. Silwood2]CAF3924626.1 unnamed protein product [Rotaria sp. Silwood2]CAF4085705.1 unnamed protein product [Rotaria sp. Silwood2]
MCYLLINLLIIFSINYSIHCSYHYVGCYTQIFHDSYFTSSFMEPTLCFRLCDTPVIYLQSSVCRCSGGGLMHYKRQNDELCKTSCTKPVDRAIKTVNTCGGALTYSAYVQNKYFIQHGHLFDYQIHFASCESWLNSDVYEKSEVQLNNNIGRSSLNKLEKCAAACLDTNATTKSIGILSIYMICTLEIIF